MDLAEEGTATVVSTIQDALSGVGGQFLTIAGIGLGIGVGVLVLKKGWGVAKKFF